MTGISFDNDDITVDEAAGTATVNVLLTGNVQGGFTIDYTTNDGSAVQPGDYTTTAGTLTFAGNDGEVQPIVIPIIDDNLIEPTEDLFVDLSNLSTNLIAINDAQATVNITDNDNIPGVTGISFDNTQVDVIENAGTATFIVRLAGNVQGGFTLDYASADGTAIQVDDYTSVSGTLTFAGTDGESYEIVVPITNDLVIESNEGYVINLSNLSTTVIAINTPQASGGIIDDDLREIMVEDYTEEYMILCIDEVPEIPVLTYFNGCGDYQEVFTEEIVESADSDDYMIVRTWNVTDVCGNTATFEQVIMVMQLQLETYTIDICVEDDPIDLTPYLPENFDTNGEFSVVEGTGSLNGSFFDPGVFDQGEFVISYYSKVGTCTFLADFNINVNYDCVECGKDEIIVSKALTPNGDGHNDLFTISGAEYCFFVYDVMIFNRWGDKVYEGADYQNTWGGESPRGSVGTTGILPSGTYYYIINVVNRPEFGQLNGYIYLGSD